MINNTAQCACLTTKSLVAQCHAISAGRADVIDKTTRTAFGQRRARVRLKFSSGNCESPDKILFLCYHRNLIKNHLTKQIQKHSRQKKHQLLLKMTCQLSTLQKSGGFSCPGSAPLQTTLHQKFTVFHGHSVGSIIFFEAVGCQSFHFGSSQRAQ